jgi:hypothetical protein
MSISVVSPIRLEAGAVLIGAVAGAIGAVILEPVVLLAGVGVAAVFTAIRILDRAKVNSDAQAEQKQHRVVV